MSTIYTNHPDVKKIALAAYPDYNGKKFSVEIAADHLDVRSYWDGGSRNYYVFLRLDTFETMPMPQQSAFDAKVEGADRVQLIPGMVCVEHTYFQGHDLGITIHVHPENAPKFISEKPELSRNEQIVLVFTRSYKNSYGGQSNIRFHEATGSKGISLQEWVEAVQSLQAKKMLNKAAAITNEGRNAIGDMREYDIK